MQGVSVTRSDGPPPAGITIEAGRIRVVLDPVALAFDLTDRKTGLTLAGLAPHVELGVSPGPGVAPAGAPGPARVRAVGELKAAAGPAVRVEQQAWLADGIGLRFTLEVPATGSSVAASLAIENRSPREIRVEGLAPLAYRSGAAVPALAAPLPSSLDSLPVRLLRGPSTRLGLGFTTARRCEGRVEMEAAGARPGFRLASLTEAAALAAGASLESERAWLAFGEDEALLLVEWARRAAAEMEARVPAEPEPAEDGEPSGPKGWTRTAATSRAELELASASAHSRASGCVAWTTPAPTLVGVGLVDALALPPAPDPVVVSRALDLAFTGRRLWLLDPGPALRPGAVPPTDAERTRLCASALLGGVWRVDGDPAALDPERARWRRLATPPLRRGSHARRIAGGRALVTPLPGGRTIVLLVNESGEAARIGVALAELGLDGPHHAFEFWTERALGPGEDGIAPARIAAGGSRLLALTPASDRAVVIGTTLHLGMGALEVAALRPEPAGALSLTLRLPGRRRGAVWIAAPGEAEPRRIEVELDGALTLAC